MNAQSPDEQYYQYQKSWEWAFVKLSLAARRQMMKLFEQHLGPGPNTRVLDVGVTVNERGDSNFLERHYPYPQSLTCAGLDPPSRFRKVFPHLDYLQINGHGLPFPDRSFDVVCSLAVVEHVGSRDLQRAHIAELLRVGKAVFLTTPNRRFPIEPHTMLPLVHWLPDRTWRGVLRAMGRGFYASDATLNPLSAAELRGLFPPGVSITVLPAGVCGAPTNAVAIAHPS